MILVHAEGSWIKQPKTTNAQKCATFSRFSVSHHFPIGAAGPVGVCPSSYRSRGRQTLDKPGDTPPHSHARACRQIRVCNEPNWPWGSRKTLAYPWKRAYANKMETGSLLWGNCANHCTAVQPHFLYHIFIDWHSNEAVRLFLLRAIDVVRRLNVLYKHM